MEEVNEKKVYLAAEQFRRSLSISSVIELERAGLDWICRDNDIDYTELNEAEKDEVWLEMVAILEEIEFNREFSELYEEDLPQVVNFFVNLGNHKNIFNSFIALRYPDNF